MHIRIRLASWIKVCYSLDMTYYVTYVLESSPSIKQFASKKALDSFVAKFHTDHAIGNWIDLIFSGKIIWSDDHFSEFLAKPKKTKKKGKRS